MAARLRDMDGARAVQVEARGSSVFLWGKGFCYEFDRGLAMHVLAKELGLIEDCFALMATEQLALSA